ncbi:Rieske (2Fe-2S) protein [Rariglobus hedericola]|uniref:Rieske (2Fe-2S) protein n=1 Tax=Rariglobus hedericola TaxID=2597822 RepID=A0A556QK75_9BACT|nr:Rieske (2Fe-2S) protein [Rariglobus hedericola]TSJ77053.1 Rieske (2Fe-2S) protein [Rariglobus hedericola]
MNRGSRPCEAGTAAPLKSIDKAFALAGDPQGAVPKKRTREVVAGRADEVPEGARKIVQIGHLSIGIFHLKDGYHAVRNYCPHQGAELCKGSLHGTHRPGAVSEFLPDFSGRVLRCPWHGWEFDLVTGKGLYDAKSRVMTYEVRVNETGDLILVV